jgi:hypothetical protein
MNAASANCEGEDEGVIEGEKNWQKFRLKMGKIGTHGRKFRAREVRTTIKLDYNKLLGTGHFCSL